MTPLPHEIPPTGRPAELARDAGDPLPLIHTLRTTLRIPVLADLPAWYAILCTDRSVYMDGPCTRDEAFTEFAASVGSWLLRGFGAFAVEDRATRAVLGFACLNMEPGDREPELGYFFLPQAEGRGLAFEATAALRDWAIANGLPSLVSYTDPANTRSNALAARLGARRDLAAESAFIGTEGEGVQVWRHFMTGER